MRRSLSYRWLGTGVLAGLFVLGCRQIEKPALPIETIVPNGERQLPSVPQPEPLSPGTVLPPASPTGPISQKPQNYQEPPLTNFVFQPVPQGPPVDQGPRLDASGPQIHPTGLQTDTVSRAAPPELPVPRMPAAHHSEHLWLVGLLEQGTEPGTWAVRYAGPEENDPHGGRLMLVAAEPILGYRLGQVVRVEDHVVKDRLQTVYQVERIETLPQD